MCGIFGIIAHPKSGIEKKLTGSITEKLFVLSESRGKESSGIAIKNSAKDQIFVYKKSVPATELIKSEDYQNFFREAIDGCFNKEELLQNPFALIAHARLVTNGSQENNNNNQPVIKNNLVTVHNGIITNVDEIWNSHPELKRSYEVDTEVYLELIYSTLLRGESPEKSISNAYQKVKGTISSGVLFGQYPIVAISTNNSSLYFTYNIQKGILIFASERFILKQILEEFNLVNRFGLFEPEWSNPDILLTINLDHFTIHTNSLKNPTQPSILHRTDAVSQIVNFTEDKNIDLSKSTNYFHLLKDSPKRRLLYYNPDPIKHLNRCSKCLLPETFPYIVYDQKGECNYCKNYIARSSGGRENELKAIAEKFRSGNSTPDCVVPFSGGRDSSFGLHYIVKELGLKPITYTFDWGMVTDLARRNIARLCGKLGVENIIVSADIQKKRRNIRLNVEAWLKKPALGMIPLFMAGDKQFIVYTNHILKQTGIKLNIYSSNMLENTDFKAAFCGVKPESAKERPDALSVKSLAQMIFYYGKNFATNPSYINASIPDTLSSFYSYYAEPRTDFYQIYDWIKWDEQLIERTLFEEYDWEISPDTTSTWRIGDGTAAFYNYIYFTVAGFSEFDTFRSNQIREGLITREQGMDFLEKENRPRFESLMWYFDTIGVDFEKAIKTVNSIPKLYNM